MASDRHTPEFYIKTWGILVVLLIISVVGPMFGVLWLTLVTAFGIACVKAYLVAVRFMHINEEPKFISYMVVTCLVFMLLFFSATAPDVMQDTGTNWTKDEGWQADSALAGNGGHHETPEHDSGHGNH